MTARRKQVADQLRRAGWVLLAVGLLCAFSLVFLPSGVIAAGLGILSLLAGRIVRHAPVARTGVAPNPQLPS